MVNAMQCYDITKLLVATQILAVCTINTTAAEEWSPEQREVLAVVESYTEASHQRNLEEYIGYWHDDFLGWLDGTPRPTNKAERAAMLREYFDGTESVQYELEPLGVVIISNGQAAMVHYVLRNTIQSKSDGKTTEKTAYWTDYLVKEGNRWQLLGDHGGSD